MPYTYKTHNNNFQFDCRTCESRHYSVLFIRIMATSAKANRKRSRQEFEASNDNNSTTHQIESSPAAKKLRCQNKTIKIEDCMVRFSSIQPVKNITGVYKWKATLNHRLFEDYQMKVAVLAKASFTVINIEKVSNYEELSGLSVAIMEAGHDYSHCEILYLESVEVMDTFRGFDYDLCLIQRIIDDHTRFTDMVVIKENDSVQHICSKMKFSQLGSTVYWARNQSLRQPFMLEFCSCAQPSATAQTISDMMLLNEYVDEEDKTWTDPDHDSDTTENIEAKSVDINIDIDSCFVTLSSEQRATNDGIEEDFTSSWCVRLNYQSQQQKNVTLATANVWFVNLTRLLNNGWYDDIFTVFDAPCKGLRDLFDAVISTDCSDGPFKMHKDDRYFDEMNEGKGNIVYLDRIEVNKEYVGFGFGRCLTQKIIDNLARGREAVILKPFPLQWERRSPSVFVTEKKSFEKDKQKVIDVWETMCFYQFGGPNSEYWGRCETRVHPKMEELCKCFQSIS
eukprot:826925_1